MKKKAITQARFAKLMEVSRPAVHKLKQKGFLTRWDDAGALLVEYGKHMSEIAAGRQSQGATDFDLVRERARLAARQSERLEIELEVMRGSLLPAVAVVAAFNQMCSSIRSKILATPSRFKSLSPKTSARDIAALDTLNREILEELSHERFPKAVYEAIEKFFQELRSGAEKKSAATISTVASRPRADAAMH